MPHQYLADWIIHFVHKRNSEKELITLNLTILHLNYHTFQNEPKT